MPLLTLLFLMALPALLAQPPLPPSVALVRSAAGGSSVAAGSLAEVTGSFGSSSCDADLVPPETYPSTLCGVRVLVNESAAPVQSVSPARVKFYTPDSAGPVSIVVEREGVRSPETRLEILPAAPDVFKSQYGVAFANDVDGQFQITLKNPLRSRRAIVYLNGAGVSGELRDAGVPPGAATPDGVYRLPTPDLLTVGGLPATLESAVMTPGFAGLAQYTFTLPDGITTGTHEFKTCLWGMCTTADLPVVVGDAPYLSTNITAKNVSISPTTDVQKVFTGTLNDLGSGRLIPFTTTDSGNVIVPVDTDGEKQLTIDSDGRYAKYNRVAAMSALGEIVLPQVVVDDNAKFSYTDTADIPTECVGQLGNTRPCSMWAAGTNGMDNITNTIYTTAGFPSKGGVTRLDYRWDQIMQGKPLKIAPHFDAIPTGTTYIDGKELPKVEAMKLVIERLTINGKRVYGEIVDTLAPDEPGVEITWTTSGGTTGAVAVSEDGTPLRGKIQLRSDIDQSLAGAFVHETGHVLGIQTHSPSREHIMYWAAISDEQKTWFNGAYHPFEQATLDTRYAQAVNPAVAKLTNYNPTWFAPPDDTTNALHLPLTRPAAQVAIDGTVARAKQPRITFSGNTITIVCDHE